MRTYWGGPRAGLVLGALVSLAGFVGPAGAARDEAALNHRLTELNLLTGTDATSAALKGLLADPKEAKQLVARAKERLKDGAPKLEYNAALVLALAAEDLKDLDASAAFFRLCIDQAKKLESSQKLGQAFEGLIFLYYENEKYPACVKACKELLELHVGDGKRRVYIAFAGEEEEGEPAPVEFESYDPVRRFKPGIHRLMVQAIAKEGKYDEALKLADNLIKARPGDWLDLQLKGWVYREAGKYEEAAKIYQDVLARVAKDKSLEPKEKDRFTERYRYLLSNLYTEMNQVDKATAQLKELLAKKPDNPTYNNDLGYIWADHDQNLDEAEKHIRKALEEDRKEWAKANPKAKPGEYKANGAFLDSLAWVLFKKGKYAEARDILVKVLKDKENQALEIYEHLGDVYLALKDRPKAVEAWKKGLECTPLSKREKDRRVVLEKKIEANSKQLSRK